MPELTIATIIIVLGEACLLLDLGSRLFGSYARTPWRAAVRIGVLVLAMVILASPLALSGLLPDNILHFALAVSCFLSFLIIVHFLFPWQWGIHKIRNPDAERRESPLTQNLICESITITMKTTLMKGGPIHCLALADLHCNTESGLKELTAALAMLGTRRFDLVFILGDLGENKALLPQIMQTLGRIDNAFGIFLVRSNHDCELGRAALIEQLAQEHAIVILANRTQAIPELGITIVGLEYPWLSTGLPKPVEELAIGLTHTPDNIKMFSRLDVCLALAGHTHGGKLRFPFLGSVLVPSRFGRFFDRGWFQFQNTRMYITPGIGYFPGWLGDHGRILTLTLTTATEKT